MSHCRPVGGAKGAIAPPDFGITVNPISTKGGRLCPLNNTGTPGFSDLPTALHCGIIFAKEWLATIHYDFAPIPQRSCFANPKVDFTRNVSGRQIFPYFSRQIPSLISTSANISGEQPPSDQNALQEQFCDIVDYIVPGECGMKNGSSMIKCIETQKVIRSR